MNLPIAILLLCAMLGLVDKILGNRMGLGEEFDRGLTMMGSLALTMSGIYCFSVMLGRWLAVWLQGVSLPFDPTLLVSSVLATDMGAYSIAQTICTSPAQLIFSGVILASTLGSTISFSLPIALGSVPAKDSKTLMTGMVYGIIATPAALLVGGLMAGMTGKELLSSLLPVTLICVLIALSIFFGGERTVGVFQVMGRGINLLAIVLFALVLVQVFFDSPSVQFVDPALIGEVLTIVFKISVVVCGSFILSNLILRYFMHPILSLARLIHVNEFAQPDQLGFHVLGVWQDGPPWSADERRCCGHLRLRIRWSAGIRFLGQQRCGTRLHPLQIVGWCAVDFHCDSPFSTV